MKMRSFAQIEGLPVAIVLAIIVAIFMTTAPQSFLSPRIYLSFLATVPPALDATRSRSPSPSRS